MFEGACHVRAVPVGGGFRRCQFLLADSSTYPGPRSLVEIEFEIKRSRTERIESLEVFPATVVVVVAMPPTLLTLWIHGVLTLVKLTPHLCRETEELD